jgi:DNA polymerase-3 subunit alpha/error-prone DNA polymerase
VAFALFESLAKFSGYGFCKAHSATYGEFSYQAAYLKAHFPAEFMAAVLVNEAGFYHHSVYIEEAKRLGIRILGPDANRSAYEFEVEGQAIRVGLTAIKGLALKTADKIVEERQSGDYLSIEDFLGRVRLTRTELLSLIRAGVFDSLEASRTRQILRYFQGLEGWDILERAADLNARDKARMLLDSLGFLPEGDALSLFEGDRPALRIKDLAVCRDEEVELLVRVVDARQKTTGSGRKYFYLFEDETGQLEGVGENRCPAFGAPPLCFVRAEVRRDGHGRPKAFNCSFDTPHPRLKEVD